MTSSFITLLKFSIANITPYCLPMHSPSLLTTSGGRSVLGMPKCHSKTKKNTQFIFVLFQQGGSDVRLPGTSSSYSEGGQELSREQDACTEVGHFSPDPAE